jgi:hypothetical protein
VIASFVTAFVTLTLAALGHYGQLHGLDGRVVDPFAARDRSAYVFVFVRPDCPISNRYAPELTRLNERFSSRGVTFALVYPGDTSTGVIRDHLREYSHSMAALRDPDFSFVGAVGATVTPEAAVFDSRRSLLYLGRIDDRYISAGQMLPAATRHDLQDALEAILDGRDVQQARVPAVGCLIADLR